MRGAFFFLLLVACQSVPAEETLCSDREKIVFSCHVGRKIVSLCGEKSFRQNLVYRFGLPGRLELIYPGPKIKGPAKFYRSSAPLYGGGYDAVAFTRGSYEYKIYSKIGRMDSDSQQESRIPIFEDGIEIFKNGKLLKRLVCDDGGQGFREDVAWIPRR
jgi:hypothetical protein